MCDADESARKGEKFKALKAQEAARKAGGNGASVRLFLVSKPFQEPCLKTLSDASLSKPNPLSVALLLLSVLLRN